MTRITVLSGKTELEIAEILLLFRSPRVLYMAGTRAARTVLQQHFAAKDKIPNRMGGHRTHFWADIRNSTQVGQVTDTSGEVDIGDRRFAQKLYGGTIVPKQAKALTIPVDKEAYGRRASVFEQETGLKLFLIKSGGEPRMLATAEGIGGGARFITVRYVLKQSVFQAPDPTALPPQEAMDQAANKAVERVIQAKIKSAGGTGGSTPSP